MRKEGSAISIDIGRLGIVFGSLSPPEHRARGAALAEELGFEELWFSEDCFFTGGISGMTQLLASTRTVPVGLGLASAMTRHPGGTFTAGDDWVDEFAVAGTPAEAATRLRRLYDAGADSVGLWLLPADRMTETLRTLAASWSASQEAGAPAPA